jgi:2-hydroxychromene-2-carboxylate isomerase
VIELFFDFISPYSYLAWTQTRASSARVGREIEPRPVLFAGILNALGTKGPAEVPARRAYVMKDILRAAHRVGVTVVPPPAHPFNPLPSLRVAALDLERDLRWRIIDALFAATWAGGNGIDTAEKIGAVLRQIGADDVKLLQRAQEPEAKERLRRNTDEAIARGAFGVPTFFVGDEMFFGFDSLPWLEAFLRGEDPAAQHRDLVERWAQLPSSAIRPGSR